MRCVLKGVFFFISSHTFKLFIKRIFMKTLLIVNIGELVQYEEAPRACVKGAEMSELAILKEAYVYVEDDVRRGL